MLHENQKCDRRYIERHKKKPLQLIDFYFFIKLKKKLLQCNTKNRVVSTFP